jgi:hypothetical protein
MYYRSEKKNLILCSLDISQNPNQVNSLFRILKEIGKLEKGSFENGKNMGVNGPPYTNPESKGGGKSTI